MTKVGTRYAVAVADQAAVSTQDRVSKQNIEEEPRPQEAEGLLQSPHQCVLQAHDLRLPGRLILTQKGTRS